MMSFGVMRRLVAMIAKPSLCARRDTACAFGLELTNVALGASAPVLLKLSVDALTNGTAPFDRLILFICGFVIAWTGTNATTALKAVFTLRIIDKLARRIVLDATRSQLPALARRRGGDSARLLGIMERLTFSLQIVIDGLLWRAAPLAAQTFVSLAVVAALVPPRYVGIMTIVLAAYFLAARQGAAQFQEAARNANATAAAQSQTVGDILRNARRVVFNGNLHAELDLIGEQIAARRSANERVSRLIAGTASLQSAVLVAGMSILLVLGASDVSAGRLTIGDFALLQAYAFRLASPLGSFAYIIRQAGVSLVNIAEALDLRGDKDGKPSPSPPCPTSPAGRAEIELDSVSFRYGDDWVLRGASARIAPGAFVVLVGPNGSGKSTLAQIMAGLVEPLEGAVSINGLPMHEIDPDARCRLVLYTPQAIGLFNRTLSENALYPPTLTSEAELTRLLAEWRFYESGRPIDLELPIGEHGARLSGGQMQKLELARLAGIRAPIVILDETTSALDQASEERAVRTMRQQFRGCTTLILITHRIATAREADLVLFLENGRLEAGAHESLTGECPAYRRFCGMES
ncbi:ATP-binding cassette domain-containing protein [Hyphococcus luteus]|nr:ABC transporter ATP-binding protein [Marinicaulis flavus]